MSTQIVTLESASLIPLPLETVKAFGLQPGSRIAVTVKDGSIVLQPLLADSLDKLRGIFSSDIDLVEELQNERRQDRW